MINKCACGFPGYDVADHGPTACPLKPGVCEGCHNTGRRAGLPRGGPCPMCRPEAAGRARGPLRDRMGIAMNHLNLGRP